MTAGLQKRDYIFVSDVVDVVMKLIKLTLIFTLEKVFIRVWRKQINPDLAFQVAEMFPKGAKNLKKVGAETNENYDRSINLICQNIR